MLSDNFNYDFNFQETVAIKPQTVMLPGDSFIVTCWFDSMSRTEGVIFKVYYSIPIVCMCVFQLETDQRVFLGV